MSLRRLGIAGALLVAGALALSALLRETPHPQPPQDLPPGFRQQVGGLAQGATTVETVVTGPVSFVDEDSLPQPDGGTRRVPRVRVDGHDPEPAGEDRMLLHDVVITRYGEPEPGVPGTPRVLLQARAPEGIAPLSSANGMLALDRSRPLQVRDPVLTIPDVLGGRTFQLVAPAAELDQQSNELRCDGPFDLRSEGLHVAGSDLYVDPATHTLRFGERAGAVRWEIEDQGLVYRGDSDGGGSLEQLEDGRQCFTLPARERCHLELPARQGAEDFFPASLDAGGARMYLVRSADGWRPQRTEGDGPVHWRGPAPLLDGGDCAVLWDELGACGGLDLRAPLRGARAGLQAGFATSAGGGWFEPDGRTSYLYGRSCAWDWDENGALGSVSAGWLRARQRAQEAGGGVAADLPRLAALADAVEQRPNGTVVLDGAALLYPADGGLATAAAQHLERAQDTQTQATGGFTLAGWHEESGQPWSLIGRSLEAKEQEDGLWLTAHEGLALERGGTVFRGAELVARGEDYAVLSGTPATAEVPRPEGGSWRAEAQRFVQDDSGLLAQGAPVVRVPAADLQLAGDDVVISSGALRYRKAEQAWEWTRGVRFSGALTGSADSAVWSEEQGLQLRGGAPALDGVTADGARFHMAGRQLDLGADGSATLEGEADARFTRTAADGKVESIHIQGDRGHVDSSGGWFDGGARAETEDRTGEARRIEWQAREQGLALLQFIHDAHLKGADGEAWGEQVNLDQRSSDGRYLEMWGKARAPARLELPEGRTVVGDWLRFDLDRNLISTAQGEFRGTPPDEGSR